jgi:uncharacterized protein YciI
MIFAVIRRWSGSWDFSKPIEAQPSWSEHAEFMDRHHESGEFLLVGPLADGPRILIVIRAGSAKEVERLLADDPWTQMGLLETESVDSWTLRLGSLPA